MCGQDMDEDFPATSQTASQTALDNFPWHVGIFDAHNHIGERMATAANIPSMKARCLAVMATRSQDQSLVASLATAPLALTDPSDLRREGATTVLPGFGRHPWFSHELYDDTSDTPTFDAKLAEANLEEAKLRHYGSVLTPPVTDAGFVADLPTPTALSGFIAETRDRLRSFPLAMVGEIGIDRAFRLPDRWTDETRAAVDPAKTLGGRNRRPLSRHGIAMEQQKKVLMAQLRLAGEMGRPVSVHGVQAHGTLFDLLVSSWRGYEKKSNRSMKGKGGQDRRGRGEDTLIQSMSEQQPSSDADAQSDRGLPYPPRICLHSFSGRAEGVRQYLNPRFPAAVFFSFSRANNLRDVVGKTKMEEAVAAVPGDRLLIESDIHTAGGKMDSDLEETYRVVCAIKGWELEEGARKVAENWEHFVFGAQP